MNEQIIPLSAPIRQAIKINTLCKTCKFILEDCGHRVKAVRENGLIKVIKCEKYIKEEMK